MSATKALQKIRRNADEELRWCADTVLRLNALGRIDDFDVMDCFQEVASKLHVYKASWREGAGSSLESWIRTQAKRDAQRHADKLHDSTVGYIEDPGFESDSEEVFIPPQGGTPDDELAETLESSVAMERLRVAIAALPEPFRKVTMLRLEGLTYGDIGERLGVSKQTAFSIAAVAETRLRATLDKSIS